MLFLTPTREARDFLLVSVVLLCASVPSLTDEVYTHVGWARRSAHGYVLSYLAVTMALGAGGWLLVGMRLFPAAQQPLRYALAAAAWTAGGAVAGVLAARADRAVTRAGRAFPAVRHRPFTGSSPPPPDASSMASLSLSQLLAVAAAEELVFRGVLPRACLALPRAAAPIGLALTAVLFPLSHSRFGWRQVLAKTPLSVAALACVLLSHSLLPALAAHGVFNADMWREIRRRAGNAPAGPEDRPRSAPAVWPLP